MVAYQPCRSSKRRLDTVYSQQRSYFRNKGDNRCPRVIFGTQLHHQLHQWLSLGDQLLLFIDVNENLAKGPLSKLLHSLNMHDVIAQRSNLSGPATHAQGKQQIDGVFATPNLHCSGDRFLPLWTWIGDHREIVVDIYQETLYGKSMLKVVRPTCHRLQCDKVIVRDKYNISLLKQMLFYKLPDKHQLLIDTYHTSDMNEFELMHE